MDTWASGVGSYRHDINLHISYLLMLEVLCKYLLTSANPVRCPDRQRHIYSILSPPWGLSLTEALHQLLSLRVYFHPT